MSFQNSFITNKTVLKNCKLLGGALIIAMLLSACSGGGADVEENPVPPAPPESGYSGPPPKTDDIQQFKINLWDNLSPNNRCGQCHGETQEPMFVNLADVNLAYSAANGIVNLSNPSESRMVTKVKEGHNCWLSSDSACADTISSYISAWAGGQSGEGNTIELTAPPIREPGSSRSFPESSELFGSTVYPLVRQYCSGCHDENSNNPISPFFANADVDSAYAAAKSKIDLDTAANSRFVVRLRSEFHNCWSDCALNSQEMQTAIENFSSQILITEIDPNLLTSKALFLTDGIVSSGGGRHDTNVIALWNFKTGTGFTAFDTSGIEPAANLQFTGDVSWVGGWGIQLNGGKAQASTQNSSKLHELITATGEYSIEAWAAPANVTQEEARIVSYSAGLDSRNFTLGQTLYNYDFYNRSSITDANGDPALSTDDNAEIAQTALQHVVATFSPTDGRKLFVNSILVAEEAPDESVGINDWNDTYALVMGNEVSNNRPWMGTLRMAAIHNRALTQEQILQNFDVGVGEKFFMLFSISHLINQDEAYIAFTAAQYDSYSYLFEKPFFINLNGNAPQQIDLEKIRIGINGKEAKAGQAYKNLVTQLDESNYGEMGQPLSEMGTIISLEKGVIADQFFLTFEKVGTAENIFVEPQPPTPPEPTDLDARPDVGIRDFLEIHSSMSEVTGVSMANAAVSQTYEAVKQQLPTLTDIDIFNSAQQMGITQLAIEYCNALVDNSGLRSTFFNGFDFEENANTAFNSEAKRDLIFNPLIENVVGTNISNQPTATEVKIELNALTDKLTTCLPNCSNDRTQTVVKAVCASMLGSAALLIQ